jgi:tetratricopeptide (TPR) repeat protein
MDQLRQRRLTVPGFRDWEQRFLQLERAAPLSRSVASEIARFYFFAVFQDQNPPSRLAHLRAKQQSLAYYRKVLAVAGTGTKAQDLRNVSLALKYLASEKELPQDTRRARAAEAVAIDRQRIVLQPANFEARLDLAFSLGTLGDTLLSKELHPEAISAYRESTTLRQQAARLDATNVFALRSQFYPVLQWAWIAAVANSTPELEAALAAFTDAAAIAKPPASPLILARITGFRGILAVRQGQPEPGCQMLRAATASLPPEDPYRAPVDTVLSACRPANPQITQPAKQ